MIIEAANQLGEAVLFSELKRLREKQIALEIPRLPGDLTSSKAILEIFLETKRFKEIYQKATEIFQQSMSREELQIKKDGLPGEYSRI